MTGDGHEKEHEIGCRERGHGGGESHKLLRTALLQYGYAFGDEIQRLAQKRIEDDALFDKLGRMFEDRLSDMFEFDDEE